MRGLLPLDRDSLPTGYRDINIFVMITSALYLGKERLVTFFLRM